jgi:hypothetical protein
MCAYVDEARASRRFCLYACACVRGRVRVRARLPRALHITRDAFGIGKGGLIIH